jgi:guanylate kinase
MKIIGCQFNKISGPDATSSYKIEFTVDESQRQGVLELATSMKKGTELLLMVFESSNIKDNDELKELVNETPEQTKLRLHKKMYALMNNIAADKKIDMTVIKDSLKKFLVRKKYIVKSTKELDLKGYAAAIFYLQTEYNSVNYENNE